MQVIDKLLDLMIFFWNSDNDEQVLTPQFLGAIKLTIGANERTVKQYFNLAKDFGFVSVTNPGVLEFQWKTVADYMEQRNLRIVDKERIMQFEHYIEEIREA